VWKKLAKLLNSFVVEQIFGLQVSGEEHKGIGSFVPILFKGKKDIAFHFHHSGLF